MPFDLDALIGTNPADQAVAEVARLAAGVGELIRQVRQDNGWTQAELAMRMGTSQAHISDLERGMGKNGPTLSTIVRAMVEGRDRLVMSTEKHMQAELARTVALALSDARAFSPLATSAKPAHGIAPVVLAPFAAGYAAALTRCGDPTDAAEVKAARRLLDQLSKT